MFYKDMLRNASILWNEHPSLKYNLSNVWKFDEYNIPIFPDGWFLIKEDPEYIDEEKKGKLIHFSNSSYIVSFQRFETPKSFAWLLTHIGLLQDKILQCETYNILSGKRSYRYIEYPDAQRTEYAIYGMEGELIKWGFEDPYTKADYMINESGETVQIL